RLNKQACRFEVYIGVTSKVAINDLRVEIQRQQLMTDKEPHPTCVLCEADSEVSKQGVFAIEAGSTKLCHLASWVEPNLEFTLYTTEPFPPDRNGGIAINITVRGSNTLPL